MGNRISLTKRKCNITREKSFSSHGPSFRVVEGFDPAMLQSSRSITNDDENLSAEVPDIAEHPPSPCPAFYRRNENTGSNNLKNSFENPGYLTVRQFEDAQQHIQKSSKYLPEIDEENSDISSVDIEEEEIIDSNDQRENESDPDSSLHAEFDEYATIHPRINPHEQHNPEYFMRGCYPRVSQRTNASKDSAYTDSCLSDHGCSRDYMCVNCVCRKQHIEYMVDVYKKRLQRDLRVEDILKELHCIEDIHKEEIEKKTKESRHEAVDLLLGYIRHSDEPGKWQNFIEALDSTGNTAMVKLLRNETENDSENSRKILSLMSRQLVYSITVDECLDLLYEEELLNDIDKDIIETEKKNNGQLAAAHKMFSIIPTKSDGWEKRLPGILRTCGLGDVAELMQFSEECQESTDTSICKNDHDETDLKKVHCSHKKAQYDVNHHRNGRLSHEMHYETIYNDRNNTDKVINELRRHVKLIEVKVDSHNNALSELGDAQQKDIRKLKSSFNDLQKTIKDLRKHELDIIEELKSQRKIIQNMELKHAQEFNDLKNSLNDIRCVILKSAPSPPVACKATVKTVTADSGFSGGLSSIPEDEIDCRITYDFEPLSDDSNEYQTWL